MQKKDIDSTLSILVIFMLLLGMVIISSVSVYSSYIITKGVSNSYFLTKTIFHVIVGIFVIVLFSKIPYTLFERYSKVIFFASIVFLLLVFIPGISSEQKGSKGWINIPGLPSIQPMEFAKIGLMIMLAYFIKKRRSLMGNIKFGLIPFLFIATFVLIPLVLQPDFGAILILVPTILAMYFVGGGRVKYIAIGGIVALIGAVSIYGAGKIDLGTSADGQKKINRLAYISARMDNFLRSNKEIALNRDKTAKNDYQLKQGFIALGSGGFSGLGFGKSIQKFGYLPEAYGDFIFSIIVEEMGFLGGTILIVLYLIIGYRGYMISRSVNDLFGKYLAFGITTLIMVQTFVNIGVNLNVVPLTGVTLPFISYGGSSIFALTIGIGILLSISRSVEYKPQNLSQALKSGRNVTF